MADSTDVKISTTNGEHAGEEKGRDESTKFTLTQAILHSSLVPKRSKELPVDVGCDEKILKRWNPILEEMMHHDPEHAPKHLASIAQALDKAFDGIQVPCKNLIHLSPTDLELGLPQRLFFADYLENSRRSILNRTKAQFDYVHPYELVEAMIGAGAVKSRVAIKDLLIRGFYSGSVLAVATALFFTIAIQSGLPFLGSTFFPFGFVSIVLFGMELVTGNMALLPMATWAQKCTWGLVVRNWFFVWIGNFVGAVFVAFVFWIHLYSATEEDTPGFAALSAKLIAVNKLNVVVKYQQHGAEGFLACMVRGLFANWLVCMGVTMGLVSKSVIGKIVGCWIPITAFQTLGGEHIVVNMFIHTVGPMLGSGVPLGTVLFWNFLPATLGNIVGGVVFIASLFFATHHSSANVVKLRAGVVNQYKLEGLSTRSDLDVAAQMGAR